MTLRHMRIFQKIYETQSVTRAAEALHMDATGGDPRPAGAGKILWTSPV